MTPARVAPALITLLACGLFWLAYDNVAMIRGTILWDLRFVVLACLAALLLTLAERFAGLFGDKS